MIPLVHILIGGNNMRDIELVYESNWILEMIYKESDRLRNKITDTTIFEDRVVKDVGQYLLKDKEHIKNKRHIVHLIKRKVWEAENKFKKEHYTVFTSLENEHDEDGMIEYDPEDVLADIESTVIKKETIELLAENDRRKKKVLESWSLGNTNVSQISRSLARSLGGNEAAHYKFIQRFQSTCRDQLSRAI